MYEKGKTGYIYNMKEVALSGNEKKLEKNIPEQHVSESSTRVRETKLFRMTQ